MMNIDAEFDRFFEFPTDDKSHVTATSAKLFARYIAEALLLENEKLRRGEFICQRCGLRKDGEHDVKPDF